MVSSRWIRPLARGVAAIAALSIAAPALAGNGNVLYLKQDSGLTSGDNTFSSDQSHANYSSIGSSLLPATQLGSSNSADVTVDSACGAVSLACGHVELQQDSNQLTLSAVPVLTALTEATSVGQAGLVEAWGASTAAVSAADSYGGTNGNTSEVAVLGNGDALNLQFGKDNQSSLSVDDGIGSILQIGVLNQAKLQLNGSVNGSVVQVGKNNTADLQVSGSPGSSVVLTQLGNSHSYTGNYNGGSGTSGSGVTVWTNTTVNITQSNL